MNTRKNRNIYMITKRFRNIASKHKNIAQQFWNQERKTEQNLKETQL